MLINAPFIARIFLTGLLAFPVLSHGASFDCAAARSSTEIMICKHADLSALDSQLQVAYQGARAAAAPTSQADLLTEQRHWVRYVRDVCLDEACFNRVYKARITMLQQNEKYIADRSECNIPDGRSCFSVIFFRDPAAKVDAFRQSLEEQRQAGKLLGCEKLIDLPVGSAEGNHSYGGLCTLQQGASRSTVMICNDEMIGHFGLRTVQDQDVPDEALIDFTRAECFGG
jgi:uncharacterized protein